VVGRCLHLAGAAAYRQAYRATKPGRGAKPLFSRSIWATIAGIVRQQPERRAALR
jgi:hypothetical protein